MTDELITGGAGLIGSHLVKAMVSRSDSATVLGSLSGRHDVRHFLGISRVESLTGWTPRRGLTEILSEEIQDAPECGGDASGRGFSQRIERLFPPSR